MNLSLILDILFTLMCFLAYMPRMSDRMVYISNIPYDVRWMELKDLVREKAGDGM